jgi:hypothetical protein
MVCKSSRQLRVLEHEILDYRLVFRSGNDSMLGNMCEANLVGAARDLADQSKTPPSIRLMYLQI